MTTITALLQHKVKKSSKKPLRWLRKAALAEQSIQSGPYGDHEVFPCSYATSGGSLKIIEKHIEESVDPYLNKETILSRKVLAEYREEARNYIHKSTNCDSDHVVIFTESEFTEAVATYLNALDVARLATESARAPVICVGHDLFTSLQDVVHKFNADPMEIQMTHEGCYDLKQLETFLKFYKRQGRVIIGVFSVGDEASGALQDTQAITGMLHSFGALSFWDYTSTGAYVKIDMCPLVSYEGLTKKDAAFINTSRFLGGAGGVNVLITNTSILRNSIFESTQDGIVAFSTVNGVLDKSIAPHSTLEERPETQRRMVVSPLRTRSVFELKGYFGECFLQKKTSEISELLVTRVTQIPGVYVMDGASPSSRSLSLTTPSERGRHPLPYFSLFLSHPQSEWALHPGFVKALLSDLFGIGVRVVPASMRMLPTVPKLECDRIMHDLLKDSPSTNSALEQIMNVSCVHMSLMHFMKDDDLKFLLSAISIIAEQGWKLLPFYRFDPRTSKWMSLKPVSHRSEVLVWTISKIKSLQSSTQGLKYRHSHYIDRAKKLVHSLDSKTIKKMEDEGIPIQGDDELSLEAKQHRWFMIPSDVVDLLDGASPVRLGSRQDTPNKKKIRSWPCVTSPNSASMKQTHVSHKHKLG